MKKTSLILVIILFTLGAGFTIMPVKNEPIPFPEGFRQWAHIKTGLIGPANPGFKTTGGFHHIYANDKAMKGYTSGYFPNGSIIVFDVLETVERDGNTNEGKRRHIDVMIKDSTLYKSTGGWGYEEFKGNSKTERVLTETVRTQCFTCHTQQKDYIFSEWRD